MLCGGTGKSNSCSNTTITGSPGTTLNVTCQSEQACESAIIDGRDAALLRLNDCTQNASCLEMEIWCPQKVNGQKMCILDGNDNLGINKLFAINSWNDIEFMGSDKTDNWLGTMYCTDGYDEQCTFGVNEKWQCDDTQSVCYDLITNEPTAAPTTPMSSDPTLVPVAVQSNDPSRSPTAPIYEPTFPWTTDFEVTSEPEHELPLQTLGIIVGSVVGGTALLGLICCGFAYLIRRPQEYRSERIPTNDLEMAETEHIPRSNAFYDI